MSDETVSEKSSKSARKREIEELRTLADRMAALSDDELVRLGVDEVLRRAIAQVRAMRPSGARNRQIKHCVRYMDVQSLGEVRAYLEDRHSQQISANQRFHRLEQLRDRLVQSGDEALAEVIDDDPTMDRQRLRQLVRDAQREVRQGSPAGAGKKLFQFLREHVS